ncbi:MAG: metal-dependent transcriptional regulator [Clostridia bacterium]|nr:metal-dependent transcriptional regulator [Clostridia bacterium]
MKLTNSQEEYLKTIYILEKNKQKVRVTDIADKLKITKPSVNKAINLLKDNGVINYQAYGEITLTKEGEKYAIEIIKKQDILKMFLVEILDIDEKQAQEEAKAMKHAISQQTAKKLNKYITQIMNLGNLDCDYDENSKKCQNCIKITAKNRLKNAKK